MKPKGFIVVLNGTDSKVYGARRTPPEIEVDDYDEAGIDLAQLADGQVVHTWTVNEARSEVKAHLAGAVAAAERQLKDMRALRASFARMKTADFELPDEKPESKPIETVEAPILNEGPSTAVEPEIRPVPVRPADGEVSGLLPSQTTGRTAEEIRAGLDAQRGGLPQETPVG